MADPLIYWWPVFAVALLVEGVVVGYRRRAVVSGLACAAVDQITAAWGLGLFVHLYSACHTAAGVAIDGALGWLIAIVLHDFAYYWFHRASHRIGGLWAAHVVHHQGGAYDLTLSLRQGAIATWISYAFYLPVALIVSPTQFVVVHAGYQVFQFFVHTRMIGSLGVLEWLIAGPLHHRVHHAVQARYLDRNYGGLLIVFDRLFGTFASTDHGPEPICGVPGGYDVASPTVANSYMFVRLAGAARRGHPEVWWRPPAETATIVSSAAHPMRPGHHVRWLSLIGGCGAAVVTTATRGVLPLWAVIATAIVSVALLERACAALDG